MDMIHEIWWHSSGKDLHGYEKHIHDLVLAG